MYCVGKYYVCISEDVLMKVSSGKRLTERRGFLFDGLFMLCKPNSRRQSSVHQNHPECKLKERFFIRKVEIIDLPDTEGKFIYMCNHKWSYCTTYTILLVKIDHCVRSSQNWRMHLRSRPEYNRTLRYAPNHRTIKTIGWPIWSCWTRNPC